MAKEEMIEMEGTVTDVQRNSRYRVTLENGHEILAYTAGKMRKFRIRVVTGDKVNSILSHGRDACPPSRHPLQTVPSGRDF